MTYSIYRFLLDIHEQSVQKTVNVKKSDNARKIEIAFKENGALYNIGTGCTAVFRAKKSDGTVLFNACTIADNVISYILTNQTTAAVGTVECEITLYGADQKQITSPKFLMIVDNTLYSDSEIESEDEFTALVQGLASLQNLSATVTAQESARVTAESARVSAETLRVTAESLRAAAENVRQSAENGRVLAESSRVLAENSRVAAESSRASAEGARASAESRRVSAETERVSAENARVSAESLRVSAEVGRVSSEAERESAEAERDEAETERETKWGSVDASATTLSPGSSATASVLQDGNGTHYNFGIPKGDTGDCNFATFEINLTTGILSATYTTENSDIIFALSNNGHLEVQIG